MLLLHSPSAAAAAGAEHPVVHWSGIHVRECGGGAAPVPLRQNEQETSGRHWTQPLTPPQDRPQSLMVMNERGGGGEMEGNQTYHETETRGGGSYEGLSPPFPSALQPHPLPPS